MSQKGHLIMSLLVGERAIVHTEQGDVIIQCLKTGENRSAIRIEAPKTIHIDRTRVEAPHG